MGEAQANPERHAGKKAAFRSSQLMETPELPPPEEADGPGSQNPILGTRWEPCGLPPARAGQQLLVPRLPQ